MKIAICAQSNNADAAIDTRFGRAACFGIFDTETNEWTFSANPQNLQAAQGAGIQAAQAVIDTDADVLLANNVGPKAMAALSAGSVDVFAVKPATSLQQALEDFTAGKLTQLQQANVEGHWM